MEDNYLWDRSGEPDPEVQELEEILGRLRYQPRPLEIPNNIPVGRRRTFFPAMAIAAAIGLLAILLGLWFSFNRRQTVAPIQARDSQTEKNANGPASQVTPDKPAQQATTVQGVKSPPVTNRRPESPRNLLAQNKGRGSSTQIRRPALTAQELAEKEQVLIALRLVSAKLNLAQRKAQGTPQLNMIRNQHKVG